MNESLQMDCSKLSRSDKSVGADIAVSTVAVRLKHQLQHSRWTQTPTSRQALWCVFRVSRDTIIFEQLYFPWRGKVWLG